MYKYLPANKFFLNFSYCFCLATSKSTVLYEQHQIKNMNVEFITSTYGRQFRWWTGINWDLPSVVISFPKQERMMWFWLILSKNEMQDMCSQFHWEIHSRSEELWWVGVLWAKIKYSEFYCEAVNWFNWQNWFLAKRTGRGVKYVQHVARPVKLVNSRPTHYSVYKFWKLKYAKV